MVHVADVATCQRAIAVSSTDIMDVSQGGYERPAALDLLPIHSSFQSRTPGSTIFGDYVPTPTSLPHFPQNATSAATSAPKSDSPMTFTEWEDDPVQDRAHGFRECFECNTKNQRSDVCVLRGDVRFDPKNDVVVLYATERETKRGRVGVRPYTRKWEAETMESIHETTIISMDRPQSEQRVPDAENKSRRRLLVEGEECMDGAGKCGENMEGGRKGLGGEEGDGSKEKVEERDREEEENEGSLSLSEFSSLLNLPHNHAVRKKAYTHRLRPPSTQKEFLAIMNTTSSVKLFGPLDTVVHYHPHNVSEGGAMMACDVEHNVPAVLFSTSGFTGNIFHDFNDGQPLFRFLNNAIVSFWDASFTR